MEELKNEEMQPEVADTEVPLDKNERREWLRCPRAPRDRKLKPEDLGMLLKGWTCTSNTDLKQQGSFFVVSEA